MLRFALIVATLAGVSGQGRADEQVRYDLYKFQHRIGAELTTFARSKGSTEVRVVFSFSDRATTVPLAATLSLTAGGQPRRFQLWGRTSRFTEVDDLVVVTGRSIAITRGGVSRTVAAPSGPFFVGSSYAPVTLTGELLRYWRNHGSPAKLPVFPLGEVTIERRGRESVKDDDGKTVALERFALGGLHWGLETAWLDDRGELVAVKGTDAEFDHFEATRSGFSQALSALVSSAGADGVAALGAINRGRAGPAVAYVGGRLLDGTGRAAVNDAVVVVRDGKIATVGGPPPPDARIVQLAGKTILPGLWDMHAHVEQVECGPLYLAAGVTTVRDCGNEIDFIRAVREAIAAGRGVGPRLLLACLVDGEGDGVVGMDRLTSAEQIPALIKRFAQGGCAQVKIYSSVAPALIAPLAEAAHRAGMTVTGHIPRGVGAVRAVTAGMDGIEHLSYLVRALVTGYDPDLTLPNAAVGKAVLAIDVNSAAAKETLGFFARHHTVVDPTLALQELFAFGPAELRRREPGLAKVPPPLRQGFTGTRTPAEEESYRARFAKMVEVVAALHRAGVPVVAGTDQAVPGHSLHRELELFVEAGFTPMEALQAATLVPARTMGLEREVGTVEVGKRADLLVVDGDPLADIRALRNVTLVVAGGVEYDPAPLWRSVGFEP